MKHGSCTVILYISPSHGGQSMWIWIAVIVLVSIILLSNALFIVRQQTSAIVERFGRFKRIAPAGLNIKIPFIDRIAGRLSLRIQQLDVEIETKTKDNVFVVVIVSVQYFVLPTKVVD